MHGGAIGSVPRRGVRGDGNIQGGKDQPEETVPFLQHQPLCSVIVGKGKRQHLALPSLAVVMREFRGIINIINGNQRRMAEIHHLGRGRGGRPALLACPAPSCRSLLLDAGSLFSSRQSREMAGRQMHFPCKLLLGCVPGSQRGVTACSGAPGWWRIRRKDSSAAQSPGPCPALGHISISPSP